MESIIDKIQISFTKEAKNSPVLLSDLANMEFYIAESYQNRSVIELLQNADDAFSTQAYLKVFDNTVVFANNGNYFTDADVESICRSGASGKKRGNNTIGYRGIGFKSVVNICKKVHIFSNKLKMTFCKELTKKVIDSDLQVPLIRIPHHYSNEVNNEFESTIKHLQDKGFKSVFVFESVKKDNLGIELEAFDTSSLLFLRHINQLTIDYGVSQHIRIDRDIHQCFNLVSIKTEKESENWLVMNSENTSNSEAIAFLMNDNKEVVPLCRDRAVVHSFLPTQEYIGFPFKLNGDFSTDPSRTKVTLDEFTKIAIDNCIDILLDSITFTLMNHNSFDLKNVLKSLTNNEKDIMLFVKPNTFRSVFFNRLKEKLHHKDFLPNESNKLFALNRLCINPKWLNDIDFVKSSKALSLNFINPSLTNNYPEINQFCISFAAKQLSLLEALEASSQIELSTQGGLEILSEIIRKYRYTLDSETKKVIKKARFLKLERGFSSLNDINKYDNLDKDYKSVLGNYIGDSSDIAWFFKAFEIDISDTADLKNAVWANKNTTKVALSSIIESKSTIEKESLEPKIFKWRSAEENLKLLLEKQNGAKVIDVSKNNLGYDLEETINGIKNFIEVKSVEHFGQSIALTSNEYATASEAQQNYILALVKQTNSGISVVFIQNPTKVLSFNKRVTRWEWSCDDFPQLEAVNYEYT